MSAAFVRQQLIAPLEPPRSIVGTPAWLRPKIVRQRPQHHRDAVQRVGPRRSGLAGDQVHADRRGMGRIEPRRLPGGDRRPSGRRLLAVHRGQVRAVHVRLLSGRSGLAGQSDLRDRPRAAGAVADPARSVQDAQRAPVLRRISGAGVLPAGRGRARSSARGDAAVGRAAGDAGHHLCRHHRLGADRYRAGARTAIVAAAGPLVLHHLHRSLARRAADHGAVLRDLHAAVLPAGELEARSARPRAHRRRAVRRSLYGGGDPRRAAGDPARPIRGRPGARPRLLEDDGLRHPAAGAQARDSRHGQFLHRAVQGHDAGADRRDLRPARPVAGGLCGSQLGDACDIVHRLCLRRDDIFRHIASRYRAMRSMRSVA